MTSQIAGIETKRMDNPIHIDPGSVLVGSAATTGTVTWLKLLNENAQAIGAISTVCLVLATIVYWAASYFQKERAIKISRQESLDELYRIIEIVSNKEEREEVKARLDRRS